LEKTLYYMNEASKRGSRVVLFPEANLTGYYFPFVLDLSQKQIEDALNAVCKESARLGIWTIVGTLTPTQDRFLNLAHVVSPEGRIVHRYAKIHLAGSDERKYCKSGNKLSLFEIDGVLCTLCICRDGRHPETYRLPGMAGAKILFHPSSSTDPVETVVWKRTSGRATLPVGPTTAMFHCVANTVGQSPTGEQTSSGGSFIRDPTGLPLAEADPYEEGIITAVLNLSKATRSYLLRSMEAPAFLKPYWEAMIKETLKRCNDDPLREDESPS